MGAGHSAAKAALAKLEEQSKGKVRAVDSTPMSGIGARLCFSLQCSAFFPAP
jgi:hypothetical protein